MTEATEVEVTQAERLSAYEAYTTCYETVPNDAWMQALLNGKHDSDPQVQLLARHRVRALTQAGDLIAWRYVHPDDGVVFLQEKLHRDGVLCSKTGWTETPLYTHTPTERERVLLEALKQIQRETTAVTPDLENLQICIGTVNSHTAKVLAAIAQAQEPE
jgi:hypothetical protein